MSKEHTDDGVGTVVEYLEDSEESVDSKVTVIKNAVDTGGFTAEDVLSEYADSLSVAGAVYPMHETVLRDLATGVKETMGEHTVGSLSKICHPNKLVESKNEVINQAINIYSDTERKSGEKQGDIKKLVKQAQRDGIEVKSEEVVTALKEFDAKTERASTSTTTDSGVDVGIENTDLGGKIQTPGAIYTGEECSYELTSVDDTVEKITWYVGGECIGEGPSVSHTFDFKGVYTLSVELSDAENRTDHVTVEVEVEQAPSLEMTIRGDNQIHTGETVEYRANLDLQNEKLKGIVWEIDGVTAGHGKTFRNTFNEEGEHTLTATATGVSGVTTSEVKDITVEVPTGITVSLDYPELVQEGDEESISFSIQTDNAGVESVKCRVGSEVVPVEAFNEVSFSHTFEEAGEYPITVNAENSNGDTDTAVGTIECVVKPNVEIVEGPNHALKNESESYSAEFDNRLSSNWSVENASLTHVGDSHAKVQFVSDITEPAVVSVSVSNEAGQTATDEIEIDVNQPEIDVQITHEPEVSEDDVVEFSATDSIVEHCDITSVQWELENGKVIGAGEEITYEFSEPGRYEVTALVSTNKDVEGIESSEIRVQPRTDVNAVIIDKGGPSTRDTFVFDASKSIIVNTGVEKWEWDIESQGVLNGESVQVEFDSPGEYNVELTVIGEDGDTDTTEEFITVEQYTDVTAHIEGPEEVVVGEEVEFNAFDSEPLNTRITSHTWFLNGNPVGEGAVFTQTFSRPGHFTISVEVGTATGDSDKKSVGIVVGSPDSIITPVFEVESGETPVVGETTTITAEPTEVKNGDLKECEWVVNNEKQNTDNKYVNVVFDSFGDNTVEMTAISFDGVTESIQRDVYVSPDMSNPPYVGLSADSSAADVLGRSVDIYQDDSLSLEDKNRVAGVLLNNASNSRVDIDKSEIESHIVDLDIMSDSEVDIVTNTAQSVESELEEEKSTSEEQDTVENGVSADEFSINEEGSEDTETVSQTETVSTNEQDAPEELNDLEETRFDVNPEGDTKQQEEKDATEPERDSVEPVKTEESEKESSGKNGFELYGENNTSNEESKERDDSDVLLPEEENKDVWETDDVVVYETHDGKLTTNSIEGYQKEASETGEKKDNTISNSTDIGSSVSDVEHQKSTANTEPNNQNGSQSGPVRPKNVSSERSSTGDGGTSNNKSSGGTQEQSGTPENRQSFTGFDEIEITDEHKEVKISPEEYDLGGSVMAMPNYVQDLIDFEYVMDEDDDLIPEGVNAAGIVATGDNDFVAIARVEGRDWSIHTMEKKRNIVRTYESHVLASLDTPIQIISLPTRFDIRDHVNKVNDVLSENQDESEELLMNIGRSIYPNWLENFMKQNDMKERQFYVIIPLSAKQLHEFKSSGEDLNEQLAELPVVGSFFERFVEDSTEDIEKYQVLRELNTRVNRIKSNLRRMDVKVERIDSRDEAMSVIYQYYNNEKPESAVFPTGPFTAVEEDARVGGVAVDNLLSEHIPADSMEENQ